MTFQCNTHHECGNSSWTGIIELVRKTPDGYEAVATARGTTFIIIAGSYQNGNYLCVPNLNFGCELSRYDDVFWNSEKISCHLNRTDTESLVCAIKQLPKFDEVI